MIEQRRGRYQPLLPNDRKTMHLVSDLLERLGAISTMTTDGESDGSLCLIVWLERLRAIQCWRGGAWDDCLRSPARAKSGPLSLRPGYWRGLRTLNIGTHNFMDADEVELSGADESADQGATGRLRFQGSGAESSDW